MLKLLICLFAGSALAVAMLQLRQQRTQLEHATAELHDQIEQQQAKLWNQQLQIAVYTAPNAISQTVSNHHMKMVPETALPGRAAWTERPRDQSADAE